MAKRANYLIKEFLAQLFDADFVFYINEFGELDLSDFLAIEFVLHGILFIVNRGRFGLTVYFVVRLMFGGGLLGQGLVDLEDFFLRVLRGFNPSKNVGKFRNSMNSS